MGSDVASLADRRQADQEKVEKEMTRITAQDIRTELKKLETCEGLDQWIVEHVKPRFLKNGGSSISVDCRQITWFKQHFIAAMQVRGFTVKYISDSRPGEWPYFEISL